MKPKSYTLAKLTEGLDVTIQGNPECEIHGVSNIENAQAGTITFLINPLYKKYLPTLQASAVILSAADAKDCSITKVITSNPHYIYARIARFFEDRSELASGIHKTVVMGTGCKIHPSVNIGANCVIGHNVALQAGVRIAPGCVIGDDCEINENTHLEANVTLYHNVKIGKRVHIASGTVIGSDGFGNVRHQGRWHHIPQLGRVIIGDDVEIGANCAIDRGAIEDTIIENGVRLDNLIQVGHNVRIGENTAIAGCVGIAGSADIGKNCLIGGLAGINGHITIADNVMITGMTAVTKSIREPGVYSSGLAGLVTNQEWRKNSARFNRLEQLMQRVKNLESALNELTAERKET